jgi:hypothetical protein
MEELLKIPCTLTKYQGMRNRSIRLIFDSQENLTDEQVAKMTLLHEKFLWLCCFSEEATESDMLLAVKDLPKLEIDKEEKSPSKRLRDRMFIHYQSHNGKSEGFNEWYSSVLDKIGQDFLDKV